MSYYDVIGVPRYATFDQIKSAYRQQIKFFHPDVFDGIPEVADIKTRQLNEAYEVLSNPERRFEYDRELYLKDKQFVDALQNKCNFYQAQAAANILHKQNNTEPEKTSESANVHNGANSERPHRRKKFNLGVAAGLFALLSIFAAFFYMLFNASDVGLPTASPAISTPTVSNMGTVKDPSQELVKSDEETLKELAENQWQDYLDSQTTANITAEHGSSPTQGIPVYENPSDLTGEEYRNRIASQPKTSGEIAWESQKETWETSVSEQDNTSTPSSFIQEKAEESRQHVDEKYGSGYYGSSDYRAYNPSGTPALQTPKDSSSDLTALLKPSNEEVLYKRDDLAEYTSEIIVHASDESDCVVKLKSHATGTTMYAFYVKSGRTAEKPIPPGTYDVCFAFGVKWYGYENLFGEYTSCSKDENIEFIYGTAWEYTLTPVQFGNLTLDDMDLADMLDD